MHQIDENCLHQMSRKNYSTQRDTRTTTKTSHNALCERSVNKFVVFFPFDWLILFCFILLLLLLFLLYYFFFLVLFVDFLLCLAYNLPMRDQNKICIAKHQASSRIEPIRRWWQLTFVFDIQRQSYLRVYLSLRFHFIHYARQVCKIVASSLHTRIGCHTILLINPILGEMYHYQSTRHLRRVVHVSRWDVLPSFCDGSINSSDKNSFRRRLSLSDEKQSKKT